MAEPRGVLRRPEVVGLGLVVAAVAGFLLGACGGGDGSALTTRTGATATRPAATATRPEVTIPTRTTPTVPTPTVPTPTVEPPVDTEPTPTVTETETETETGRNRDGNRDRGRDDGTRPDRADHDGSRADADGDDGGGRAVLRERHAVGLDRPRGRSPAGASDRAPRLEAPPGGRRLVVRPARGPLPTLSRRPGRCPRPGLGRDRPDPGTRRRGAVARDAGSRRSFEGGRGPRARQPRRARGDARGRPQPPTRLAAPEPGAALVLDGTDSPAGRGAPERAAAAEPSASGLGLTPSAGLDQHHRPRHGGTREREARRDDEEQSEARRRSEDVAAVEPVLDRGPAHHDGRHRARRARRSRSLEPASESNRARTLRRSGRATRCSAPASRRGSPSRRSSTSGRRRPSRQRSRPRR